MLIILLQVTFTDVKDAIGIVSSFVIAIAVVAGIVWFVFKGKSLEACREDLTRAEKRIIELEKEAATADRKKNEAEVEKAKAEKIAADREAELKETEGKLRRSLRREEQLEEELEKLRLRSIDGRT